MSSNRLTSEDITRCIKASIESSGKRKSEVESMISPFLRAVPTAQVFDFGDISKVNIKMLDKKLACQLWNKKLLALPFPQTIFTFRQASGTRSTLLAVQDGRIANVEPEADIKACAMLVLSNTDILERTDAFVWFNTPDDENIQLGCFEVDPCQNETQDQFQRFAAVTVGWLLTLCLALNVKGIRKRYEPVPVKLNKKRAASGKAPLSAVTYVDLRESHGSGGRAGGGEKCMHLRRGHLRHYSDGSLTWVRDTVVKAEGELKKRERYQVQGLPK